MENTVNKEIREDIERKRDFHRVIDKIRNLPKPNEAGPSTSNIKQIQPDKVSFDMETPGFVETESMSSDSDNTIAVPAINFNRYLGATGVRYINRGQVSKVQDDPQWDLKETVRQVDQKFATDLKTITRENRNDVKLLKTLICLERQAPEQVRAEYKEHHKYLSTSSGIVFYDDKIVFPQALDEQWKPHYIKDIQPSTRCQQPQNRSGCQN